MGYRSQVVIVIAHELEVPDAVEKALVECFGKPAATSMDGDRLFACDWIKWYCDWPAEYPDVCTIHDWVTRLNADAMEYVLFQRIGESSEDVEEHGFMQDNQFCTEIVHEIRWSASSESQVESSEEDNSVAKLKETGIYSKA